MTQVWLSTFTEVVAGPLGPVWIRPIDYREATKDIPFDPKKRRQMKIYRCQPERERLVEERMVSEKA